MSFLLVVIAGLAGYAWWRIDMVRRAEADEEQRREGYRRRIAQDPKNIGAHEALGESLHRAGRLEEARDAFMGALDAGADGHILDIARHKLKRVDDDIRERAQARGRRGPKQREYEFCRQCGHPNQPHRRFCEMCQAALAFSSFFDALRNRELQRSSLEGICMIAIVLVLLRILSFIPTEIMGLIFISTLIVVAWRMLKSIDGSRM